MSAVTVNRTSPLNLGGSIKATPQLKEVSVAQNSMPKIEDTKLVLSDKINGVYQSKCSLEHLQAWHRVALRVTLAFFLYACAGLKAFLGSLYLPFAPAIAALHFTLAAVYFGFGTTLLYEGTAAKRTLQSNLQALKKQMDDPKESAAILSSLDAKVEEVDLMLSTPILPPYSTGSAEGDKNFALKKKSFCLWLKAELLKREPNEA